MTVFQLNRPRAATWADPASAPTALGRHASALRAKLTVKRMFYTARHISR